MTLSDCKIIELPKEEDPRGSLTYIYENVQVPFPIKRVFYIYDVPAGKDRGAHAHKECWQFIIAASGALEVYLSDGKEEKTVTLNRPFQGLTCEPGMYIREEGIGIRIENDLLVTEGEPVNLFEGLPIEIEEIEAAMKR